MVAMSKQGKNKGHKANLPLAHLYQKDATAFVISCGGTGAIPEPRKGRYPLWPEWSEADINSERWDAGKGKEKDKSAKSPSLHLFDDPEGKIEMPLSLMVHTWKRPHEFISDRMPVVVENELWFDLMPDSQRAVDSELMRWIIADITSLWKISNNSLPEKNITSDSSLSWKPWEHIYSLCKAAKGHMPQYNNYGKYVVKLFWMGCWRKIIVDDTMPFDQDDNLLLPATTITSELWPMLLSKALVKIASIDMNANGNKELGDFTVIHALAGWNPEIIPINKNYADKIWTLLMQLVPEFKLTPDDLSEIKLNEIDSLVKDVKEVEVKSESPVINKITDKVVKGTEKQEAKDSGKKKNKEVEKDKNKSTVHSGRAAPIAQGSISESPAIPAFPQMVVCASYSQIELQHAFLQKMGESSEMLRCYGFSSLYSHSVMISRTRSCPLKPPQKPPTIPRWKLIRPRNHTLPSAEPREFIIKKPDQFVEIASPFIHELPEISNLHLNIRRPSSIDTNKEIGLDGIPSNSQVASPSPFLSRIQWNAALDLKDESANLRYKGEVSIRGSNTSLLSDGRLLAQPLLSMLPGSDLNMTIEKKPIGKETWIDYDDFCKCFQTLVIFHKPNSYPFTAQRSDMKPIDERGTYYLFVDNLKPTEILVTFSALVRWGDINCERLPSKDKVERRDYQKESSNLLSGLLLAEPYSWTSLITNAPILHMRTYATKSVMLMLPEGRHVLRFIPSSPLGHHIQLCSTVSFTFGEEETILSNLSKESLRFVQQAQEIMKALGNVLNSCGDEQELAKAEMELMKAHVPPNIGKGQMLAEHMQNFQNAFYATLALALRDSYTSQDLFAIRVITQDFRVRNIFSETLNYFGEIYDVPQMWKGRRPTATENNAAITIQAQCRGFFVRRLLAARVPGTKDNEILKECTQRVWLTLEPNADQHGFILLRHIFKANPKIAAQYQCAGDEWTKAVYTDYVTTYADQFANSWFVPFREVFYASEDVLVVPKVYCSIPICALHVINNDTGKEFSKVFQKTTPFICTKNKKGYTFVAEARTLNMPLLSGKWKLRLIGCQTPLPTPARDVNGNFSVREIKDYYVTNKKCIIFRYQVKVMANHMVTIQTQTSKPEVYIKLLIFNKGQQVAAATGKGQAIIPAFKFCKNTKLSISHSSSSKNQHVLNPTPVTKRTRTNSAANLRIGRTSPRTVIGQTSKVSVEEDSPLVAPERELSPEEEGHKYIIQGEVLNNSWTLTKNEMAFIEELQNLDKNEIKVFGQKFEEQPSAIIMDVRPSFESRVSKKSKGGKEKVISRPESRVNQLDFNKPHYIMHIVSDQNEADMIEIKKDSERVDEIRAMKQAWEDTEPGRALKAMQSRLKYIKKSSLQESDNIESIGEEPVEEAAEEAAEDLAEETTEEFDEADQEIEETKDLPETDVPTPLRPLTSPTIQVTTTSEVNKQYEEQIERTSAPSGKSDSEAAQNEEIGIKNLDQLDNIHQFRKIREAMLERREREQNARVKLQLKQLETYENLQVKLDEAREAIFKKREAYRSKLIEAETKKQQEIAAQEAALYSEQEKKSPTSKKKSSNESKNTGKKKKK
uniref:Androglobin n=1 Tax=Callorhinchus milii TaxID=7868 RepID=A0A0K1NWP2_CALMI|nr:androglobin [Callorhinchus milii]